MSAKRSGESVGSIGTIRDILNRTRERQNEMCRLDGFWARLNRQIIAERAAEALRADVELVTDAPHSILTQTPDGWLHRKGAGCGGGSGAGGRRAQPPAICCAPWGRVRRSRLCRMGQGGGMIAALCMGGCEDDIGRILANKRAGVSVQAMKASDLAVPYATKSLPDGATVKKDLENWTW